MQLLIGILVGIFCLTLIGGGYRFSRILFPIWGFLWGFVLGAAMVSGAVGTSFLGSVFGIITGLAVGLLFAALIYAYYYAAIVLMGAGIGYWIGSGFILLLGLQPGLLSAMAGIALGVLAGMAMVVLNMPRAVLIVLTSLGGAILVVGGVLLAFHQIPVEFFSLTTTKVVISNSFLWSITSAMLAAIGIVAQFSLSDDYEIEEWGGRNLAA